MATFYRLNLSPGNPWLTDATSEGWVGVGWLAGVDLTAQFPPTYDEFRERFVEEIKGADDIPTNLGAAKACSTLWHISNQVRVDDYILVPTDRSSYRVARVAGPYTYRAGSTLPHRRAVEWSPTEIPQADLSPALRRALGAPIPLVWIRNYPQEIQDAYDEELKGLVEGNARPSHAKERLEESVSFVMEKYLEEFLVGNWGKTILSKDWDLVDSQVQTATGPLDILARSKNGKTLLVIELKLRRASDNVLGQVQRYMGWVKRELEPDSEVAGLIIGDELDPKLEYALSVVDNVSFMRYEMDFRLLEDD